MPVNNLSPECDRVKRTLGTKLTPKAELSSLSFGLVDPKTGDIVTIRDLTPAGLAASLTATDLTVSGTLTTLSVNMSAHPAQALTVLNALLAAPGAGAAISKAIAGANA